MSHYLLDLLKDNMQNKTKESGWNLKNASNVLHKVRQINVLGLKELEHIANNVL